MKRNRFGIKLACLIALAPVVAQAQRSRERDWRPEDHETIRRSFTVSPNSAKLVVDNISGFVHVTGYSGNQVQVTVEKRIRAESNAALEAARREVKLEADQQGDSVRLYVDGPFRSHDGVNYRGDSYYGYRVTFDYEIQVPEAAELSLKIINDGGIVVKHTTGPYDIHGLNGGIEMEDIAGSGSVRTLNGPVKVAFSRNPSKDSEFHTLNGRVDVYFQPGLDADLHFHTLNGGVYSDFEMASLPGRGSGETVNGMYVYRSNRRTVDGRAGKGGPELTFRSLNGKILLHSKAL